ncbi:MAG TPA: hypothetical protein VJB59_11875 [Bdellovibrionota bacterium]|nr:hypothetical protein [Bdellovibrionota bacterium]
MRTTIIAGVVVALMHSMCLAADAPEHSSKGLCADPGMKELFYSAFMNSSHMLKHRYTVYYRLVSDETNKAFDSSCKLNPDGKAVARHTESACLKACDKNATGYFKSILPTKGKEKELFNECALVCTMTSMSMWHFVLGAGKASACASEVAQLKEAAIKQSPSVAGFSKLKKAITQIADKIAADGDTAGAAK